MRRALFIATLFAMAFSPAVFAEEVSIEDVFNFPEVYTGREIGFDMVEMSSDFKKDKEFFCLEITSKGGEKIAAALKRPGITFVATDDLLRNLLEAVESDEVYPAKLKCMIVREQILGEAYYLADIREVGFYGAEGKVIRTITAKESVTETAGPAAQVGEEFEEEVIQAYQPDDTRKEPGL